MPGPTIAEEVCVSARSAGAALDAAAFARVDATIARVRSALILEQAPPPLDPTHLVRYIPPEITKEPLEVRIAGALDPKDATRGWVVVEAVSALGRSDVPLHLTALIDVSDSMVSAPMSKLSALQEATPRPVSRLELGRAVLARLIERLPARSEISLLVFARDRADVVLAPTMAAEKETILRALRRVREDAARLGRSAPLSLAYDMAGATTDGCADRRVLIVTDDRARFAPDPTQDIERVRGWADRGVELWTLSLGTQGTPSPSIEALTEAGRGVQIYADVVSEAVEPLTAALRATGAVGRDPTVQVSFGPEITSVRRMDGAGLPDGNTDTWVLPDRIDAGFRRVELYEVTFGQPNPTASVHWSLQSPVPGEWKKLDDVKVSLVPLSESPPFVRERVFAWTLGKSIASPDTDWAMLAAFGAPLVSATGPSRELLGWVELMQR